MKKLATVSMSALMIALLVGLVAAPASAQNYPPTPTPPLDPTPPSDHHSPPSAQEADLRGQRHLDQPW